MLTRKSEDIHSENNMQKLDFGEGKADAGSIMLHPVWKESGTAPEVRTPAYHQREIILLEPIDSISPEDIEARVASANCRIIRCEEKDLGIRYEQAVTQLFLVIQSMLMRKPKDHILIQVVLFTGDDCDIYRGLAGLLKTAQMENPKIMFQVIQVPAESKVAGIAAQLEESSRDLEATEIRYEGYRRYEKRYEETGLKAGSKEGEIPWQQGGVYLITGGAGGLGLIFAEEIAKTVQDVKLILTGRSELSGSKQAQLASLRDLGANVEYRRLDITKREQVQELIAGIAVTYGRLNGILHSAGIIRDNYMINKTVEEFAEVLQPKVAGLLHLDTLTSDIDLDFIILFSSGAGETGNPGQADYAAANAFMDGYASYRNKRVEKGERRGRTLSVNWPLWEQGGMRIDREIEKRMFERVGMIPMKSETGIQALYQALAHDYDQVMVMEGDCSKLRSVFMGGVNHTQWTERSEAVEENVYKATVSQETLHEKAEAFFKKLLSSVIKLPASRIESDAPLEKYGIDSLVIMKMTDELEKTFGSLSKTLFFEYQNIRAITEYFLEFHRDRFIELLGLGRQKDSLAVEPKRFTALEEPAIPVTRKSKRSRFAFPDRPIAEKPKKEDIAIIGISGRYPQANNLDEFWDNLCRGTDSITEIPRERWDYHSHYDADPTRTDKTNSKWGGFMDDVDKFDPLFFNITPKEAEFMDPQERLFLECVFETLEDAGYTRETLSKHQNSGMEGNVGVYVGVMYDEYQLYGAQAQTQGRMLALSGITSSVANRVSYFCNFHGPSIGINTMCSSSLVSIHLACQGIQQGECELAIAGGVNVSIHPNKYLLLGRGNFVSSKGRCESFGQGGDGYVPGEGVGAILLKPLSKAIEDRDHIYGVIKGSAINHGGKTNGYTVPNPNAQASMIKKAFKEAKIEPRSISYIEAHGTGTALGDPIEITALTKAFEDHTSDKQFCSIGSVKSNIGHLESAAGIVGVTKVLLQLKYRKLVPSLHSTVLNPNIDFERTPFKVQQALEEWKRPVIEMDGVKKEYPRLAGISAFGAGGTNAHLVIEEYIPAYEEHAAMTVTADQPAIILLSGKEEENVKGRAKQLLTVLENGRYDDSDLLNIAYTLQIGREAMETRLAMTATSIRELAGKLRQYVEGHEDIEDLYSGRVKREKDTLTIFNVDDDLQAAIDSWISKGKYGKLLDLWVKGLDINWETLYSGVSPRRISLPTYPFSRERYWIPQIEAGNDHPIRTYAASSIPKEKAPEMATERIERTSLQEDSAEHMQNMLTEKTVNYLKKMLSSVSSIPLSKIEADVSLEAYGIDSVMIKQLAGELERSIGTVSMTIFFEYQTLQSLADYLMRTYNRKLLELFDLRDGIEKNRESVVYHAASLHTTASNQEQEYSSVPVFESNTSPVHDRKNMDIAIIGLSGRYPQAKDIHEFWENLKAGKDCIVEIPKERWDYTQYYDADKFKAGKINSKWGGFIDDVDKFDPLFFNISPDDAEYMDPQERLFLECVYETIEDAGYTRETLSKCSEGGLEANVGVFVGVTFLEYQLYGIQSQLKGKPVALSGIASSIANRVSYFCNFNGPSVAIDSMCSSSLSALHMACDSIKLGGCKLAVVGGVNLSLHPNKYLFLSQYNFMSSKGRCESFGSGGDGYVPGEGVGAVLLKPLAQAEADGDQIYGVIKSTAANHGGKTNGYSVPNPSAQAQVIHKAMADANVDPRSIGYIEAHGTGTSLGDPIEIAGLTKAFHEYTHDTQFCAIGSLKSNIGHLEAAAGIAGVTKVLLQLKHRQIVPSLHSQVLNSNIEFEHTPFRVQQELEDWKAPVFEMSGEMREHPRLAGISSFGAGGSNSHIIIEEYVPLDRLRKPVVKSGQNPAIILLSAKKEDRLKEQVRRLLEAMRHQPFRDLDLADIAYTLQVGREGMEERLGMIVSSIDDLQEKLEGFLKGKSEIADLYKSQGKKQKTMLSLFKSNEELQDVIRLWIERKKYSALLDLWVTGVDVNWELLYDNISRPRRISLPTYPFARERYWLPDIEAVETVSGVAELRINKYVHPLLHHNTSTLEGQRFSSTFTGNEFFLKDHAVMGERLMPIAAYLEMARAAVYESVPGIEGRSILLKNIMWSSPMNANDPNKQLHIGLYPDEDGGICFEIYADDSDDMAQTTIYCQGQAIIAPEHHSRQSERIDIDKYQTECSEYSITGSECYTKLGAIGIDHGGSYQGVEHLFAGKNNILAKLTMPESVRASADEYRLHPSMLDSAIQAALFLFISRVRGNTMPGLPISMEEMELTGQCGKSMWAIASIGEGSHSGQKEQKLNIDLCDSNGTIVLRLKNVKFKALEEQESSQPNIGSLMLYPSWKQSDIIEETTPTYYQRVIMLCEAAHHISSDDLQARFVGARCQILGSSEPDLEVRYSKAATQLFLEIQSILMSKPKNNVLVQLVIFTGDDREIFRGLGGVLKTAQQENPKLLFQIVELPVEEPMDGIVSKLEANIQSLKDREIRYEADVRYVKGFEEIESPARIENQEIPWKEGGVYLITGGAGGLGLIFAEEMALNVKDIKLILTGRSALHDNKTAQLTALREKGVSVEYLRADITEKWQVHELINGIISNYGKLNGIIHAAGMIRDNYMIQKSENEFVEVLGPKVSGLLHLDACTSDINLDFMILFSSGAGEFGNPGQADYAAANAFMDAYASYRNQEVKMGERRGKTLSINWPLWKQGGMHVDKVIEDMMFESIGMIPMETKTGITSLYQALGQHHDQVLIMEGDTAKIRKVIMGTAEQKQTFQPEKHLEEVNMERLKEQVIHKLAVWLGESIKLSESQINTDEPFETYGVDSIKLTLLSQKLAANYKDLSNTVFFEYRNISALGEFLASEYPHESMKWTGNALDAEVKVEADVVKRAPVAVSSATFPMLTSMKSQPAEVMRNRGSNNGYDRHENETIAVIGVSGRFPQANNLDAFWENLKSGKNCITELSEERWPLAGFYSSDREEAVAYGKSFSKWGGFLEGFANFDPLFFNISPAEAERMDPQERIFLEECWKAVEDAGYVPSKMDDSLRKHIGVFGGVTKTGFSLWNNGTDGPIKTTSFSSLVNRLSYFMDFQGPSVPVDTMCSSSLVALHQACESIRHGDIKIAVVGAVNLYLHPSNYTSLSQGGLISDSSASSVFGKGGIGFIPSEGVGAVVLKRLSDAEKDNDHIWAVIKGSAISHSGKTNGYNVPDPAKQAAVIEKALKAARVDARSIRHIEAAAGGSEMVDAIELSALTKVFGKDRNEDHGFYTIGSVKAGIGHGESVSGMAQFMKALLQLKHKLICPTPLPEQLNPNVKFDALPFRIETNLAQWPDMDIDGDRSPRRIGINSFGAGGVYAHLIVEEYDHLSNDYAVSPLNDALNLFVFSAKTNHSLKRYLSIWSEYLKEHPGLDLRQLAYILQTKREAMKRRFATTARNLEELIKNMEEHLNRNEWNHAPSTPPNLAVGHEIDTYIAANDWSTLARLWENGATIPWEKLYNHYTPKHISQLPTYPFRDKKYWLNGKEKMASDQSESSSFISLESILGVGAAEAEPGTAEDDSLSQDYSKQSVHDKIQSEDAFIPLDSYLQREEEHLNGMNSGHHPEDTLDTSTIRQIIKDLLFEILFLDELDEFDDTVSFMEIGLDSILTSQFIQRLNDRLGLNLRETVMFDYTNTSLLANYIASQLMYQEVR